jgi:hypothetical protein
VERKRRARKIERKREERKRRENRSVRHAISASPAAKTRAVSTEQKSRAGRCGGWECV